MFYPQQQRASQQYLQTQIMSADPLQLVILTYDIAIAGCRAQNQERALRAVNELQLALNHDEGGQIAANLLSLYLYCAELIRNACYEDAVKILTDLRQTWVELRKQTLDLQKEIPELSMAA
jgi:flagellin-specific chaperone FliS